MNTVYRHLRQRRWRSSLTIVAALVFLSFIIAPDETSAFCEDRNDGSTCHTHMVDQPLSFLRDELHDYLIDAVLFPDDSGFLGTDYSSADHFDSCNFAGGTEQINGRLRRLNHNLIAVPADHPFQGVA